MAFDCFMKIKDIDGESTDEKHKKWIEVHSFSFGATQFVGASPSTAGGRSSERVDISAVTVVKDLDKASPKIFAKCCNGEHIKEVIIELCRSSGKKQKYMEYKLEDVLVESYSPSGGGGVPTEAISLNPGKITLTYTATNAETGKAEGNVTANWDVTNNKGE